MGLDIKQPRFTWVLQSNERNVCQTAYKLMVYDDDTLIWDSGKILSDSSVLIAYKGPKLNSNTNYSWTVKIWENKQENFVESIKAFFHTGLLDSSEWTADWISPGFTEDSIKRASPYLRKAFKTKADKKVKKATVFITAHGMYEAYINGARVGESHYTPGWTSYHKRKQYQTYDVSDLIKRNNVISIMLASGWYRGTIGFSGKRNYYGRDVALLAQLEIEYEDGVKERIVSDSSWKSSTGEIRYSEIYNGEIIDFRQEKENWMLTSYNDSSWDRVKVQDFRKDQLVSTYNEPVKQQEIFTPIQIFTTPKGEQVIDFGQNFTGWVRAKVQGNPGDTIRLSHAEVLDREGNFYTANLRSAKAQQIYVLKDNKTTTLHPYFSWQGFRYVKVEGISKTINPNDFEGVALYSDMATTGNFSTSQPMINRLQSNIEWGQKSNFLEIPTDCNQRNERLGWTGDIQIFARTATYNMRVHNFLVKWLVDLRAEQSPEGEIPSYIPDLGSNKNRAGWADVATIVPWTLYVVYGDKRVLEKQYISMKAYVESIRRVTNDDLWDKASTFGDWLAYSPLDKKEKFPRTSKLIIAQSYYANSVNILAKTAHVLGFEDDAQEYNDLYKRVKEAFAKAYIDKNGDLTSQSQADYIISLDFDMIPVEFKQQIVEKFVEQLKYFGHFTTGFLATPPLCHVLTKYGYSDLAYELLEREEYPSWLYPITKGATTFWERWNGIMPDGSFQKDKPQSNSFNHYAHASIGDWMYRKMVGIDTYEDERSVGYKHIKIEPIPGGTIKQVEATLQTYYGVIGVAWKIENKKFALNVEIPVNTKATIFLPASKLEEITESGIPVNDLNYVRLDEKEKSITGRLAITIGSGKYKFVVNNYLK
ncbi:MAG: family 78 glycoside hydrolase catalytic domain [Dysgonomonas sp.]